MITDEYRIKKNLGVLLKIANINSCKTIIDLDKDSIEVRFSGKIRDLDLGEGTEPITEDNKEYQPKKTGGNFLTSGIDPIEEGIMKEQLKAYHDQNGYTISAANEDGYRMI
jgi:hypothetical protein